MESVKEKLLRIKKQAEELSGTPDVLNKKTLEIEDVFELYKLAPRNVKADLKNQRLKRIRR